MVRPVGSKKDFATRLSPQALAQLDALVRQGRFKTRTEAIEAAVDALFVAERRLPDRLRHAFERACGALSLGLDREGWRRAELDRLEWEAEQATARRADR